MPFDTRADFDNYYALSGEPWGYVSADRPGGKPIMLHYNDWWVGSAMRDRYALKIASRLMPLTSLPGARIGLIGAGFGWLGEGLADLGATVVGTDISSYILNEKSNTEEADLRDYITAAGLDPDTDKIIGPDGRQETDPLDLYLRGGRANPQPRQSRIQVIGEDSSSRKSRRDIAQVCGGGFDHIVTEELLNSVDDAQAFTICDFLSQASSEWGGEITHILSPLQPEKFAAGQQRPELNWKLYDDWRAWLNTNGFSSHKIMPSAYAQDREEYGERF